MFSFATERSGASTAYGHAGATAAALSAILVITGAVAAPLTAQDRYPVSNAGAPAGVYSAPRLAIDSLTALLQKDSLDYGANWRLARALRTLGALAGDAGRIATRDSLYSRATRYARRAARIAPERPEGHIVLAQLLSRGWTESSLRERVGLTNQILASSQKAIELDPSHDGAWNALGRWHMEVWRLSRIERFVAVRFLGGTAMKEASLEKGVEALERAVSLRPSWIPHRLDLARAYLDVERHADAQTHLDAIADLRPNDPEDARHVREAARLAEWISGDDPQEPRYKREIARLAGWITGAL